MVQLNKDFIEKYLPHGYNNLTEAMVAGITKHKVLPKSFNTHSKHSDLYNIIDTNLVAKEQECTVKNFGEKPTNKDILAHIIPSSSSKFYITYDEYNILEDLEDVAIISELNEQFGYEFESYGDEGIIDQAINGLNEEIHANDL